MNLSPLLKFNAIKNNITGFCMLRLFFSICSKFAACLQHCSKHSKTIFYNLFYVYLATFNSLNKKILKNTGCDSICQYSTVFQMQQLCSNFNFFTMICSTTMAEVMLYLPIQNIAIFWAYLFVKYCLLHVSSYIAAILQQICCMTSFFF